MNINLSDGRVLGIQVPPNSQPGAVLQFQVPPLQQQPQQQQQDHHNQQQQFDRQEQRKQRQIEEQRKAHIKKQVDENSDFEMIGLSNRNSSVHPSTTTAVSGRPNYKMSSVLPYDGNMDEDNMMNNNGGNRPTQTQFDMTRSDNRSALLDGHIHICCCCNKNILMDLSNCCIPFFFCCCTTTGFTMLPCYSKKLLSIRESEVGIIEDIGGKFIRVEEAGPILLSTPMHVHLENLKTTLSTRIQQIVTKSETKTKDNVFCIVEVSLQYMLDPHNLHQAAEACAYKMTHYEDFISDQINDIVRGALSKIELDEALLSKTSLQVTIEQTLGEILKEYGYVIKKALITNFIPTESVVIEMNNIYIQKLLKEVANQFAETRKTMDIIKAEGNSERKELLGKGVSAMRRAYLHGMHECFLEFIQSFSEDDFKLSWDDVLYLQLLLQYFDTMKGLSTKSFDSNLYISLDPKRVQELKEKFNIGLSHHTPPCPPCPPPSSSSNSKSNSIKPVISTQPSAIATTNDSIATLSVDKDDISIDDLLSQSQKEN